MSRRARRWQSAADSHYYQAGPDDEPDEGEGDTPDVHECKHDGNPMSIARWSDRTCFVHCACGNWFQTDILAEEPQP